MLTSKVFCIILSGQSRNFLPVTLPRSEPLCWHRRFSVSYYRGSDLTQKWAVVLTSKVFCIILSGQSRNFLPVTLPRSEPLCWHRRFSVSYYRGSLGTFCRWPYPEVSRCVDIEGFLYHIIGAVQELFAGDLTQKWAVVLTSKVFCIILSRQSRNFLPVTLPRSEPLCWHRRFSVSYYRDSPGTFCQWPYPEVSRCVDIEGFLYHIIRTVQELFASDLTQKWAVVLTSKVFCIILSGQSFLPVTLPRSEPLCWHRRFSVSYYLGRPGTFCRWPYPEVSRCVDIEGFLYHIIGTVQELFASDLTQKWAVVLTSKVFCIILSGQSRNFLLVTLPRSEPLCWHRRFSVSYYRGSLGTFCRWPYPEVSCCVDIEGFLYHIIGAVLFAGDLTQKWAVVLTSKVFCIILSGQSRNFLPVTLPRSEPLCWHRRFSVSYYQGSPGTFCQWPYPEVSRCVDIEGFLYHIIGQSRNFLPVTLPRSEPLCWHRRFSVSYYGAVQELFAGDLTQKWAVVLTSKVFCIILSGQSRNFLPVTLPRSEPLC